MNGKRNGYTETLNKQETFQIFSQADLCTLLKMAKEVLQQDLAALLPVLEAVQSPLLQQGLAAAVHVGVQEAREPFLQQGVDVIHHLTQQHPA